MSLFGKLFTSVSEQAQHRRDELGFQLVGCLSGIIKEGPSVTALKKLAQTVDPEVGQPILDIEVFIFHKFLVVQACAGRFPQNVVNSAVDAFCSSLQLVLSQNIEGHLDALEGIRSLVRTDRSSLDALEKLWVIRARQYDEPFASDLDEYLQNSPGHMPWKRLLVSFMSNFGEVSGSLHDVLSSTPGTVQACVSVSISFGVVLPEVGKVIRAYYEI